MLNHINYNTNNKYEVKIMVEEKVLINVENLKKVYKLKERHDGLIGTIKDFIVPKYYYKTAVNNINIQIKEGECVGYIGENGAGKSTTIKMLTGILHPTNGEVTIDGLIPYKERIKNNFKIGTVFGQRSSLWWDLPVIESFKFNKRLYEIKDEIYEENMKEYTKVLGIDELLNIPVRNLSLGQRMKCEIAIAFLHNPKIVYLDEPTIGLDVLVKEDIRRFIRNVNENKKTTIMLTTHDLKDIEEVCNRIIVIDKGQILHDGNLMDFVNEFGKNRTIKFIAKKYDEKISEVIENRQEDISLEIKDNEIDVTFDKNKLTANDIINIVNNYIDIVDLSIIEPNLESIVKEIYRSGKND